MKMMQLVCSLVLLAGVVEAGEPAITTINCGVYYQNGTPMSACKSLEITIDAGEQLCESRMREAMQLIREHVRFRKVGDQPIELIAVFPDGKATDEWFVTYTECVNKAK